MVYSAVVAGAVAHRAALQVLGVRHLERRVADTIFLLDELRTRGYDGSDDFGAAELDGFMQGIEAVDVLNIERTGVEVDNELNERRPPGSDSEMKRLENMLVNSATRNEKRRTVSWRVLDDWEKKLSLVSLGSFLRMWCSISSTLR